MENEFVNQNDNKILFQQNNVVISKTKNDEYVLQCRIHNKHLLMDKVITFDLIKLIYDLNTDIYEKVDLNKINDTEAVITVIMKNLFPDLGMPQRFAYIVLTKKISETILEDKNHYKYPQSISFHGRAVIDENHQYAKPSHLSNGVEPLPLERIDIQCYFITPYEMEVSYKIKINQKKMRILPMMEKMISRLIYKMFSRIKQFIENWII